MGLIKLFFIFLAICIICSVIITFLALNRISNSKIIKNCEINYSIGCGEMSCIEDDITIKKYRWDIEKNKWILLPAKEIKPCVFENG